MFFDRKMTFNNLVSSSILFFLVIDTLRGENVPQSDRSEFKKSLSRDCTNIFSTTCLKLNIVSWVDKLNENDDYSVLPGVSLIRENVTDHVNTADIVAKLAREFPNDADARLDAFLMRKVSGYLSSHSIRLNLWNPDQAVETGRGGGGGGGGGYGGGGGGKKGGGGGMGHMLAAAAMMKGALMAIALAALAALAGKALMTALIALVLSSVIGLKSLTSSGGKQTTYEIVSKPVYSHSNTHSSAHEESGGGHYGHSSYGRSYEVPLPIGLQPDYKPA